ncbi:glycosyl transferase [Solemya pervernicosa gill symbiont]|uniref:Glycosyl transferase n=2 Tax=Gammaproteobacteria incertae sedis TaxID=118884 RepID=A0A1T2L911_9GAMM|nr:glycosyltransferase [Candidatus Reidiella endopervernicosa]OOZ41560.1 glycosyl transferase [Solemya pervernicosa gill symbiont]QKQ27968.1 glycosyltransferase [Candidatus Reidiella endopervernicosa]
MISSTHIIGSQESGGAERFYSRLVCALQRNGAPTHAINRPDSAVAQQIGACAPQTHIQMSGIIRFHTKWRIQQAIKQQQPDIVQTYMSRATSLTSLKPDRGPIHVARLGGYYNLKRYRHAHAWIGNTRGICDYLVQEGLPVNRVFYIGNFADAPPPPDIDTLNSLRREHGIPDDAWIITAVGRLHPNKAFDTLLKAFSLLPHEIAGRPTHLLIAGDGPLSEELRQLSNKLSISNRTTWAGWQANPSNYYYLANLFVCPSRHEPLGNVILEAWAHNTPVVATASQGAMELISDGENGVVTPVDQAAPLADAMLSVLQEPQRSNEIADSGTALVSTRFSEKAIVESYLETYRTLLEQR